MFENMVSLNMYVYSPLFSLNSHVVCHETPFSDGSTYNLLSSHCSHYIPISPQLRRRQQQRGNGSSNDPWTAKNSDAHIPVSLDVHAIQQVVSTHMCSYDLGEGIVPICHMPGCCPRPPLIPVAGEIPLPISRCPSVGVSWCSGSHGFTLTFENDGW